ncbi:hypothetical protein SRHO_G00144630 [Serrasalmus rhombeus]
MSLLGGYRAILSFNAASAKPVPYFKAKWSNRHLVRGGKPEVVLLRCASWGIPFTSGPGVCLHAGDSKVVALPYQSSTLGSRSGPVTSTTAPLGSPCYAGAIKEPLSN